MVFVVLKTFQTQPHPLKIYYESHVCRIAIAIQPSAYAYLQLALCLMALYRYFKVEKGGLPNPHGPLAKTVLSSITSKFKLLGSLHSDRKKDAEVYAWTEGIDCIEGSRVWCGSLVPSLLPQKNLTSFDLLQLRADPLLTGADSPAIHENITTNIIVFNNSQNYYPSKNLRYMVIILTR